MGTGAKKSGWRPLFFYYTVVVCGWGRGNENRGKGASSLDQFDQLGVVSFDPLIPKGTMECRGEGQWLPKRVEVEDRDRTVGDCGGKRWRFEPRRRVRALAEERGPIVGRDRGRRRRKQTTKGHGRRVLGGWWIRSGDGWARIRERWRKSHELVGVEGGQSTRCWRQVWGEVLS